KVGQRDLLLAAGARRHDGRHQMLQSLTASVAIRSDLICHVRGYRRLMTDGRTWLPGPVAPPRQSRPVEHLWSTRKEGRQLDCQLRGNGEHGWELQLLR